MRHLIRTTLGAGLLLGAMSCTEPSQPATETPDSALEETATGTFDQHSYARPDEAAVTHLNLDVTVDFEARVIHGVASYDLTNKTGTNQLVLDAKELDIEKVTLNDGRATANFTLGAADAVLGQALTISIDDQTERVNIHYRTSPKAEALQWLEPSMTAGKQLPFLFTQSQAILARTWLPCPDGPGMRFTYEATVKVPAEMLAVMSAANPTEKNAEGVYHFTMEQPIPSYLMALSVGDIAFQSVGDRTGIYAEPSVLEKAAYEFAEMEDMLVAAEALYGAYRWDRYDLIVLPPSFPFGGMENPRLTFATPTILAGDRSLTSLVAHELAHSWSGNLVTNLTWDDFWLNEGFTVYFERRIMEALYGKDYADMLAILGYQDVTHTVAELSKTHPDDTHLKLDLKGRNPDDGLTDIAYEKGYFFLRMLEEQVGRESFDAFLKAYFNDNAFKSMDTEGFVEHLQTALLGGDAERLAALKVKEWIYGPGIPDNCPEVPSVRFEQVQAALDGWNNGQAAAELNTAEWSTHEWLYFLRGLPESLETAKLTELDEAFGFTQSGNSEVLAAWFQNTIRNNYSAADGAVEQFLIDVGRRKFLTPTYQALIEADSTKERARAIYAKARPGYHAVSYNTMDALLDWETN